MFGVRASALAIGAAVWLAAQPAVAAHPNALWRVVHDLCVTDMKIRGRPAPCMAVDRARGFAVVRDLRSATQVLLVPTARLRGIESPQLLAAASPNYWQDAWEARRLFEKRAGRAVPRDVVGMAINSVYGRSQSQLHIHIDCIRPDVRAALAAHQAEIGHRWATASFDLVGERYRLLRVDGADLGASDPFKMLAAGDAGARADMGAETLVVVGETFAGDEPGFVLLSARAGVPANAGGAGEALLDHRCDVLKAPG